MDQKGAVRTSALEVAVWVDTAGLEGGRGAGTVESVEKMDGWRQQGGRLECQVLPSEGLCDCKERGYVSHGNRKFSAYLFSASVYCKNHTCGNKNFSVPAETPTGFEI